MKGRVTYRWEGSDGDVDYTSDVEVLEVTMPAAYETIEI